VARWTVSVCLFSHHEAHRFISVPASALHVKLQGQLGNMEAETDRLSKRLLYLETTHKNSMGHIDQMLKRGGGGGTS
jgi:hypothetical protein